MIATVITKRNVFQILINHIGSVTVNVPASCAGDRELQSGQTKDY